MKMVNGVRLPKLRGENQFVQEDQSVQRAVIFQSRFHPDQLSLGFAIHMFCLVQMVSTALFCLSNGVRVCQRLHRQICHESHCSSGNVTICMYKCHRHTRVFLIDFFAVLDYSSALPAKCWLWLWLW